MFQNRRLRARAAVALAAVTFTLTAVPAAAPVSAAPVLQTSLRTAVPSSQRGIPGQAEAAVHAAHTADHARRVVGLLEYADAIWLDTRRTVSANTAAAGRLDAAAAHLEWAGRTHAAATLDHEIERADTALADAHNQLDILSGELDAAGFVRLAVEEPQPGTKQDGTPVTGSGTSDQQPLSAPVTQVALPSWGPIRQIVERQLPVAPTPEAVDAERAAAHATERAEAIRAHAAVLKEQAGGRPDVDAGRVALWSAQTELGDRLHELARTVAESVNGQPGPLADHWVMLDHRRLVVVLAALTQIGKPYVFAAQGPNAYDCSGFTTWAWRHGGIELPSYSFAQRDVLQSVSAADMSAGDLVFWDRTRQRGWTGAPGHVAMFLGDDNLIVEANGVGYVRVSRYTTPWLSGYGRVGVPAHA
jgi:cell wall-associated NlpC family hydrolase